MKKLLKNKKGFTLIEIIVVIVILAVLMAVAVPSVLKYINEADDAKIMSEARTVMNTAQIEVAKELVTANGVDAPDTLKGTIASIVEESGVEVDVTKLWVDADDSAATKVTVTEGTTLTVNGAVEMGTNSKKDIVAVEMTLRGKQVVAVLNDKVYVAK